MKKILIVFFAFSSLSSFQKQNSKIASFAPAGSYDGFFEVIRTKLQGKCVGYQVTVSFNGQQQSDAAAGFARMQQDPPELKMSADVKFHTASVSKTISAIALMKAIEDLRPPADFLVKTPVYLHLPKHWNIHESMKKISFHHLLKHISGIKKDFGVDYHGLKKHFETGVNQADFGQYDYQGANYGLMRLLIPVLAGKDITEVKSTGGNTELAAELMQATQYATLYKQYVQEKVFTPAGLGSIHFAIPPFIGGLCYQFPLMGQKGETFGDAFFTAGSHGWVLSSRELDKVMSTFYNTNKIIKPSTKKLMMDDAYGFDGWKTTPKGYKYLSKGGYYPGSKNDGQLHTWVVHFEQGYNITIIINSPYLHEEGTNFFEEAFDEWYKQPIQKIERKIFSN